MLNMKILLLPGLDGTGELFGPLADLLPTEIDLIVIKYPMDECMSYRELTEYVIKQIPCERFILVAESFSGPIAYQIATMRPENLQSVIFVATFIESPRRFLLKLSELLPRKFLLSVKMPKFLCKAFMLGNVGNEMIDKFQKVIRLVSTDVLDFRLREISKLNISIKPTNTKATYINASNDRLVPKRCIKRFTKAFNDINIVEVVGPHFILQNNPLACSRIIVNEINL